MCLQRTVVLITILVCGGLSCAAVAQGKDEPRGWYVGLDVGQARLGSSPVVGVASRDDSSTAYALRVGYRFTRYFALEAGYADLGEFETTYVPLCGVIPPSSCPTVQAGASIDGLLLNVVGTWPIARYFHLKGSLGAAYREVEATLRSGFSASSNGWTDSDIPFTFGVGIAVPISERFEIDLDYTHFREVGLGLSMDGNVLVVDESKSGVVMLGLRYSF